MAADAGQDGPRQALVELARTGVVWPGLPHAPGARAAAVLVLFGHAAAAPSDPPEPPSRSQRGPDVDVLLVGRAANLNHHAGQVAFPGGRVDPQDTGAVDAALREAREETGLDPSGVEVLGTLGELPVAVSRHLVTPVLGWWTRPSPVHAVDPRESAHVVRCPVDALVDPDHRGTGTLPGRGPVGPAFQVPSDVGDLLVWGFTAYVLDRVLDAVGWSRPWDAHRPVPVPPPPPGTAGGVRS
ncbi:NUDIX hydrolase [Cellulomonas bogoriensis]|uniref:NUDIX hydrolase n=1 Tax=Cellulomonas bogoriensis 69B4 = DSM 16987 TaxID=1386082 RepID=A0A0A0C2U1_9CELL|nr:CoA pyrophosphatase [Cellulomonas bogoriensis]KGM14292.1 NUDIX hydrolase [Cellulomonas bogoriensis 69B4 = DSM 16987]